MEFSDRSLICNGCGQSFTFTAGEQLFFLSKEFKNDPRRCKPCTFLRSSTRGYVGTHVVRNKCLTETRVQCSMCALETTVPFTPRQGRPVLCRQCFLGNIPASVSEASKAADQRASAGSAGTDNVSVS